MKALRYLTEVRLKSFLVQFKNRKLPAINNMAGDNSYTN